MSDKKQKEGISRRKFLKTSTVVTVGSAVAFGVVSVPLLRSNQNLLRPPGALDEDSFLAACIKCGQCLQVCPPQVIILAGIGHGFGIGTPYITPREGGCILCAGLPCVLACPTGALDHHISEGKEAEMGLAVISQPDTCLSILGINDLIFRLEKLKDQGNINIRTEELLKIAQILMGRLNPDEIKSLRKQFDLAGNDDQLPVELSGKLNRQEDLDRFTSSVKTTAQARTGCRICLDVCPIKQEQTIRFVTQKSKRDDRDEIWPVVQQTCVGCGLCEEECPTPKASITIIPRKKWEASA